MNIYTLWSIAFGSGGIYGFQEGRGARLDKTAKNIFLYGPIIAGTAAAFYFGDEIFNRFVTKLLQINHGDFDSVRGLSNIYYQNKPLVHMISAAGALIGNSIGVNLGYLAGRRIGKKFNPDLEGRINN